MHPAAAEHARTMLASGEGSVVARACSRSQPRVAPICAAAVKLHAHLLAPSGLCASGPPVAA
jgi:hypothetical protein